MLAAPAECDIARAMEVNSLAWHVTSELWPVLLSRASADGVNSSSNATGSAPQCATCKACLPPCAKPAKT